MREWRLYYRGLTVDSFLSNEKGANASIDSHALLIRGIESFRKPLSISFLPYHGQLDRNPCDASRVLSNIQSKITLLFHNLVLPAGLYSIGVSGPPDAYDSLLRRLIIFFKRISFHSY